MDSQLCRLCLQTSEDAVNIWKKFDDSTIATILKQHFWFIQANEDDGLTEWLCQLCWVQTKAFHEFYRKVEQFQESYTESIKNRVGDNGENVVPDAEDTKLHPNFTIEWKELKPEAIDSNALSGAKYTKIEPDLTIEETEFQLEVMDSQGSQADDIDHNWDEESRISDESSKPVDRTPQINLMKVDTSPFAQSDELVNQTIREEQNRELNGQIREWFTMKCDICDDVSFKTLLDVRRHYRNVHKVTGYLTCCDKKFAKRHKMVAHMRSHTDTNSGTYRCDQCDKSLATKQSLKNHIAHHVPLDSRAFKCHLCSSSFAREAILNVHIRNTHTSKNGQNYPCEKCNKNFSSELLLKCHLRQSHENSIGVCEVCARQFKSIHALRNHVLSEHSTTPQPKVQCDICGNWLKNQCSLARHLREQHQDKVATNCHICNKSINKFRLRQHINAVHGERNHRCTLCDKTFHHAKALKEHVATHTGEDLYQCQYCNRKSKSSANLSSHVKKAHFAEWAQRKKMSVDKEIVTQENEAMKGAINER